MEAKAHGTFDGYILRRRLLSEQSRTHPRRALTSSQPNLIRDVSIKRFSDGSYAKFRRPLTKQRLVKPSRVAPFSLPELPFQSGINMVAKHQSNSEPVQQKFVTKKRHKLRQIITGYIKMRPKSRLRTVSLAFAVSVVLVGGYVSFLGLKANSAAIAQAEKLTHQATDGSASSAAPSTVKPSAAAIANYVVAPNLPHYLIIPKLGVSARILSVGVNSKGALETPNNVYDTAWYNESAEPGQQGAMLVDGHVSSWTTHGVFYGINTLVPGDIIKVKRGDGTMFTYKVVRSQTYKAGSVDMTSAMTPITAGRPGLNLISCTGDVIPGTSDFNERVIVYATLQN